MTLSRLFDVAVVGGGHAGIEAACAAVRMGLKTTLVTHDKTKIGEMSCNPSFGGIGKGHLLREVDALDGVAPRACDKSGLFFKVLNKSKGPAVWGPRAQIHRQGYKNELQKIIKNEYSNLEIIEDTVLDFETDGNDKIRHLKLSNSVLDTKTVVLCTGTFLNGETHYGEVIKEEGRRGEKNFSGIGEKLQQLINNRSRTGTPPRVRFDTINWDHPDIRIIQQDTRPEPFSYMNDRVE